MLKRLIKRLNIFICLTISELEIIFLGKGAATNTLKLNAHKS